MLQDLYPHIYHNEMAWKAPAPDDYALIFAPDGTVYCDLTDGALTLPRIRDVGPGEVQYAFSIDEAAYYLVAAHPDEMGAFRYRADEPGALCRRRGRESAPLVPVAAVLRPLRRKNGEKHDGAGHGLPAVQKHRLPEDLPGRHRRRA